MTFEQLKRHMDRRFDRLQRTKADKADLKRFTTKSQVRRLRQELANRPTKDDLKRELERYATKDDLRTLAADMTRSVNEKIDSLARMLRRRFDAQDTLLNQVYREYGERLKDLEERVGL